MKNGRYILLVALAAAFLFVWPHQSTMSDTVQFVNNGTVFVEATVEIEIYGSGVQIYEVSGTWDLSWSDPFTDLEGHVVIETEIVQMDLRGDGIIMQQNGGLPSPGEVRGIEPGIDFPAESFFDVFYEIELSGAMPGEILTNPIPDRLEGLVDDFPSYFDPYGNPAPVPEAPLLNEIFVEVGMIRCLNMEMTPYYPPETHIIVDRMKGSDILVPYRYNEDVFWVRAAMSGPHEVESMEFSYRLAGSADPWTPFAFDADGSSESWSTSGDKGEGDGWSGYLDRWLFTPDGEWYEFQAVANTVDNGPVTGISPPAMIYSFPPIPEFIDPPPDSVKTLPLDSILVILIRIMPDLINPAPIGLWAFPFGVDFKRELTPVNQLAMGTDSTLNEKSCGPAAAASCLKYFADNGYPKLDNPGGDESKPNQSGEQMGGELRGAMGTNDTEGTTPDGMAAGIKSYLEAHGQNGWVVEVKDVNEYLDIGDMFTEFEADSEDVMMVLQNVLPNGDTVQHCVTLGSKGSRVYEVNTPEYSAMHVSYRVDFMDPHGGDSTSKHEYNVTYDTSGAPVLDGYKVDNTADSGATIEKFIKVSPPDSSGGGGSRMAIQASHGPGWIEIDTGYLQGSGIVDTFYWDTTGFPGGLYLLEAVSETPDGQTCRDFRLCGIPEYTVDSEPLTPSTPTKLIGSYPNPFNPMTTIEFYLARDTKVDITIYDVAGRTVRHLVSGRFLHGGTHQIKWNGIKDGGGRVSSGVYFYKFSADGVEMSSKLVLLR